MTGREAQAMVEEISEQLALTARSLREQAARCRRLARQINDRQAVRALLDLADELEQQAEQDRQAAERSLSKLPANPEPVD